VLLESMAECKVVFIKGEGGGVLIRIEDIEND
jgi:hypothetical protein